MLRDCSKALSINPKSSKAFYRSATALVSLGRYDEAEDCCSRCLSYDPNNAAVKAIQQRGLKLKAEFERVEREKQERIKKEEDAKLAMKVALRVCKAYAHLCPRTIANL